MGEEPASQFRFLLSESLAKAIITSKLPETSFGNETDSTVAEEVASVPNPPVDDSSAQTVNPSPQQAVGTVANAMPAPQQQAQMIPPQQVQMPVAGGQQVPVSRGSRCPMLLGNLLQLLQPQWVKINLVIWSFCVTLLYKLLSN